MLIPKTHSTHPHNVHMYIDLCWCFTTVFEFLYNRIILPHIYLCQRLNGLAHVHLHVYELSAGYVAAADVNRCLYCRQMCLKRRYRLHLLYNTWISCQACTWYVHQKWYRFLRNLSHWNSPKSSPTGIHPHSPHSQSHRSGYKKRVFLNGEFPSATSEQFRYPAAIVDRYLFFTSFTVFMRRLYGWLMDEKSIRHMQFRQKVYMQNPWLTLPLGVLLRGCVRQSTGRWRKLSLHNLRSVISNSKVPSCWSVLGSGHSNEISCL